MDGAQARSIRNMLFKNQQGRCHWCAILCEMPYIKEGKKHTYVGPTTFTIEHVLSKSRGGNSSIKNLVGACSRCNNWRATVEVCVEKGQNPMGRCRGMKSMNLWVYLPVDLAGPKLKSGKWLSHDLKRDRIEEVNLCRVSTAALRLKKSGPAMKTRDHVVPKSQGGVWTVDACLRCNAAKKDMSLDAFRRLRGGIEFFGEMRERLVNEATSWIVEGPEDENVVHRQMHRVVPQDISRPFYEATVDLSKITQHTRGAKTKQERKEEKKGPETSPLRSDLLGVRFGAMTVVGRITGKWVVECMCDAIEHRSTKAVLNSANKSDSCEDCRRPVTKLRSDIWHEFGVEFTYDDVFQHVYGAYLEGDRTLEK